MGDQDMEDIISNKLKAYGVGEAVDHAHRPGMSTDAAPSEMPTLHGRPRSVSFVDMSGLPDRPRTGSIDGRTLSGSRPGSSDSQHTPLDLTSSRKGILRPSSRESRPRSSGNVRQSLGEIEHPQHTKPEPLVPRPPPRRRSADGSLPSSVDRPLSGGRPARREATDVKGPTDNEQDAFAKGRRKDDGLPLLVPLAGFGVDVSTVLEGEEGGEEPIPSFAGQSSTIGGYTSLFGGDTSLLGGDTALLGGDSILECDEGNVADSRVPITVMVGEEDWEAPQEQKEELPAPLPAEIQERKVIRILRFVHWFKDMSMHELRDVARAGLALSYPKGAVIVQQGDDGDSMFVVIHGKVHMDTELIEGATVRAQKHQAHTVEEGAAFGESAIVWVEPDDGDDDVVDEDKWWRPDCSSDGWDYTQREWTAVAETDAIVLELPRRELLMRLGDADEHKKQHHLHGAMRELYEATRAATVIQRGYRSFSASKDAAKKMADMLSRAAAEMAQELKSLSPHAQAYMAMMSSLSHAVVQETQAIATPPPLRRPAGYVSRSELAMREDASEGGRSRRRRGTRYGSKTAGSRASASRASGSRVSSSRGNMGGGVSKAENDALQEDMGLFGRTVSPVQEGVEEAAVGESGSWEKEEGGEVDVLVPAGISDGGGREEQVLAEASTGRDADAVGIEDEQEGCRKAGGAGEQEEVDAAGGAGEAEGPADKRAGGGAKGFLSCARGVLVGVVGRLGRMFGRKAQRAATVESDALAEVLRLKTARSDADVRGDGGRGAGGGSRINSGGGSSKPKSALRPSTVATSKTNESNWKERDWTILLVTVIQCQELPRRNYRGALGAPVDATLEVSVDDVRYTLPAPIKRTCAPYFNEAFAFQLPEPEDAIPEPEFVKVEIVDAGYRRKEGGVNKKRRRGDSLGIVFVPIAGRGDEQWHYLVNINGETTVGRCQIRTQRMLLEGLKPAWYSCPPRERFRLDMHVLKAERRRVRVSKLVADMIEMEANKPKPPPPSNMMHPEGSRRHELDMLVFVASLVTLLLAPLAVSFDVQGTWAEWLLLASISCDGIFVFDIYTRFFSGFLYQDPRGTWKVEDRARRCRLHYVHGWRLAEALDSTLAWFHAHGLLPIAPNRKAPQVRPSLPAPPKAAGTGGALGDTRPGAGWFWLDAATCFPAEIFLAMVRLPADPYYRAQALARVGRYRAFLRVLQAVKLLRVLRVHELLNVLQRSRSTRLAGTLFIKMALYAVLWTHWIACLWFAALRSAASSPYGSSLPSNSTSAAPPPLHPDQFVQGLGAAAGSNSTGAVWWTCDDRDQLLGGNASAGGRYVCAVHWATQTMLAVGMGDVPLLSSAERVLAIIAMPLGLAVAITTAGALGSLIPGAPLTQTAFVARVRRVMALLKTRGLPRVLRKDVQRFYEHEWQASGGNDDLAMLRPLPLSLQARALLALYGDVLEAVPFLRVRVHDLRFWRILLKGLELASYMEGEWLVREGETAEDLFLLKEGQCELVSERFEGQGLDEDGRPYKKEPLLPVFGDVQPEWELLDWEEEVRRAQDEADGVRTDLNKSGAFLREDPDRRLISVYQGRGDSVDAGTEASPEQDRPGQKVMESPGAANEMGWNNDQARVLEEGRVQDKVVQWETDMKQARTVEDSEACVPASPRVVHSGSLTPRVPLAPDPRQAVRLACVSTP